MKVGELNIASDRHKHGYGLMRSTALCCVAHNGHLAFLAITRHRAGFPYSFPQSVLVLAIIGWIQLTQGNSPKVTNFKQTCPSMTG